MKEQSLVGRIWDLGEQEHGKLITAVILAVLGVICGMVPYFAAAKMIVLLLAGEKIMQLYLPWILAALAGFLARTILYNSALGISHKATFGILKTIREKLLAKLPRLPLGTVMDTSSGKLKETIVDQVAGMKSSRHSIRASSPIRALRIKSVQTRSITTTGCAAASSACLWPMLSSRRRCSQFCRWAGYSTRMAH